MINLTFAEIAEFVQGRIFNLTPSSNFAGRPEIDSRRCASDTFFLALLGEQSDGNRYAAAAIANGATFAIVTDPEVAAKIPSILVEDGAKALWNLAAAVRNRLPETLFIGLTGSSGKTTTKDLLRQILANKFEVIAPPGSFNNEIGVPLTILNCRESTNYCILEMGARHLGDIAHLCSLAKPSLGAVLGVASAHIGEFGSQANIALAKSELIQALPNKAFAVLGSFDEFTPHMADGLPLQVLKFGLDSDCQIRATDVEFRSGTSTFELVTPTERAPVELNLIGLHQINNALAAAAISYALGLDVVSIASGLSMAVAESKWRMALSEHAQILILNDSYNANPQSMRAALQTLALLAQERGGQAWAFLGKMHELGESERQEHLAIGKLCSTLGIDQLLSIGTDLYVDGLDLDLTRDEISTHLLFTQEEALAMAGHLAPGDVVLIKASRAEHLDELAERLGALLASREGEN